jgi:[protein-PII] uridylyltransferase
MGQAPLTQRLIHQWRREHDVARQTLYTSFQNGAPVTDCVRGLAREVDAAIDKVWDACAFPDNLALIAVGGYGRVQLFPHSDIDLLILSERALPKSAQAKLAQFIQALWDMKLEVGHSVRTLKECQQLAKDDLTVMSNLIDARLLAGSTQAYSKLQSFTASDKMWSAEDFFKGKWDEQQARYRKFGETAYILEPNVKQSPGGLRDIQTIEWVTKRHFGRRNLSQLVAEGFLTQAEYEALIKGEAFLWKVRFALHLFAKRGEDRLLFDYQPRLAEFFKAEPTTRLSAVEVFMKTYFQTVKIERELNDMLLQLFREAILYPEEKEVVQINERFRLCNQYIDVTHPNVFHDYPPALFEIFIIMTQQPDIQGVRARTIRLIRQSRILINEKFRADPEIHRMFMTFLRQVNHITSQLQRMNRYGILGNYIPAFGNVIGLMQYDLFHTYTVDQHTIFVIRNLRRFRIAEYRGQFPLCAEIISNITKSELLYLAALFHDIAKGEGGDHSELGANYAADFCQQHGLSKEDTELVVWLVENHLLMSMTAQRKDISDPKTIREFVDAVQDQVHLDFLYLLTIADICATNPSLWNSWKDALLKSLYHSAKDLLSRENKVLDSADIIAAKQQRALESLASTPDEEADIKALWSHLPDNYFLLTIAESLLWHTTAMRDQVRDPNSSLVQYDFTQSRAATEFLVFSPKQEHVFVVCTTLLANSGLNILEARLFMLDNGFCLLSCIVLDEQHEVLDDKGRCEQLANAIKYYLDVSRYLPRRVVRRVSRRLRHFRISPKINFTQEPERHRTLMEVHAADRPGLLSHIAHALEAVEVYLHTAKVATFGERVEDVFAITDKNHQMITDEAKLENIRAQVLKEIQIN